MEGYANWRVLLNGRQQGLNPWATERLGVRFVYSPPQFLKRNNNEAGIV